MNRSAGGRSQRCNDHPKYRLPILCCACQLEVSDPGKPLRDYRCPKCGDRLARLPVPQQVRSDQQLPPPKRVDP